MGGRRRTINTINGRWLDQLPECGGSRHTEPLHGGQQGCQSAGGPATHARYRRHRSFILGQQGCQRLKPAYCRFKPQLRWYKICHSQDSHIEEKTWKPDIFLTTPSKCNPKNEHHPVEILYLLWSPPFPLSLYRNRLPRWVGGCCCLNVFSSLWNICLTYLRTLLFN